MTRLKAHMSLVVMTRQFKLFILQLSRMNDSNPWYVLERYLICPKYPLFRMEYLAINLNRAVEISYRIGQVRPLMARRNVLELADVVLWIRCVELTTS